MPFEDALIHQVTIGKLGESQDPTTGDLITTWQTLYEADAYIETLRGQERFLADAAQVFATHRIHMPLTDTSGVLMDLDETLEAAEAVPFDYATQSNLPRYRFKLVNKPHGHHYEVDAERIEPGGS